MVESTTVNNNNNNKSDKRSNTTQHSTTAATITNPNIFLNKKLSSLKTHFYESLQNIYHASTCMISA
jgi:hypothetical protein